MTEIFHSTYSPLLSFCIPTYNRVGSVLPLVRRVLESASSEIEVVVSDNGSTDDTLAQLATIDDPRLVIISNKINRGALFNQVNVLLQGRGKYSTLLLDKDSVNPALIPSFLDFLRRESPFTGYCEYHQPAGTPAQLFQQGGDALHGIAYSCHHPSGYFFHKPDLHDINIVERFCDHKAVGNFPFEFMQAELCVRGRAAIFNEPVFSPESIEAAKAIKSFSINGANEDVFFSPKGRLKLTVSFTHHISGLPIPATVKHQLVLERVVNGLFAATVGYRNVLRNEAICTHYHIAPRNLGAVEIFDNGRAFLRWFFEAFPRGEVTQDLQVSRTNVVFELGRRLTRSLKRRLHAQYA